MPSGGHNKLSKAEKIRRGTFNVTRESSQSVESGQLISGIPSAPSRLSEKGAMMWTQLCNDLIVARRLQTIDLFHLEILVFDLQLYWELQEELSEFEGSARNMSPKNFNRWNDINSICFKLKSSIHKMGVSFGLNPQARRGLESAPKEVKTDLIIDLKG